MDQLKKNIGLFSAVMIVVGNVVGIGIFTTTGFLAQELPDPRSILLIWVIGGGLTLCGALTYGELGGSLPRTGGDYVYLREAYGPWAGFLLGWVGFFVINPGSIAALSLGLIKYLFPLLGTASSAAREKLAAIAFIILISGINYRGTRWGSGFQNLFSILNLLIILSIVTLGLSLGTGDVAHFAPAPGQVPLGRLFGPAMIAVIFTYSGWFVSAYVAGEMKHPGRDLPRSLVYSSIIVTVLYLAMNVLYLYALPVEEMQGVVEIARTACHSLLGAPAAGWVSAMIILAILGSLNSVILTSPRIYYAMARDGVFFSKAGNTHPRYHTPHLSIILQAVIASILVIWGSFYQLLTYVVVIMLVSSIATASGLFVLRIRRPQLDRPYRVWGYPISPLIFLAAYCWIAMSIVIEKPCESALGILVTASGIPFYLYWRKQKGGKR